jgi:hypothetical protein
MKNKSNGILIGVSILLVGVAGFFIVKSIMGNKNRPEDKKKGDDDKKGSSSVDNSTTNIPTTSDVSNLSFPIKKGSKSDDIKVVQQLIMQYDKRLLPVYKDDGKWGIETQTALQKIIKKSSVDSQADLDKITQAGAAKAGAILSGFKLF